MQAVGIGSQVFGVILGTMERSAAEQRKREIYEREKARKAELRKTKAGRAQLAREEREERRKQELMLGIGLAILGGAAGGGGGGGSPNSDPCENGRKASGCNDYDSPGNSQSSSPGLSAPPISSFYGTDHTPW
jgi:hypothetical protein